MPDFTAKMHQIRFRLGLRPDPAGGAYSAPPGPLTGCKGAYFYGGGEGGEGEGHGKGNCHSGCCSNVFSLGQIDGHRYYYSPAHKTSSWVENCTKFGQFILSKIIKSVASRCQILRLKCTKFDFGWGSAPNPAGGAYSAPPDLLAGFKGSYF